MPVADAMNQLPDNAKNIIEKLVTSEMKAKIKKQLEAIGQKCKDILLMFEDGLTDKEIAEYLVLQ